MQTLFLAWGMATWANPRSATVPAAPVLLRQAALTARGGTGEDFDVSLPGEWEVNPTLLHLLKTDFEIELDRAELLGFLTKTGSPRTRRRCSTGSPRHAQPLPVSRSGPDRAREFLLRQAAHGARSADRGRPAGPSDLICAIAGDEQARDAVRARHPSVTTAEPDRTPPADEFLVLDADASQSYAINCALAGAHLVIDGPPGTGKSQTIANLIATLSARGKRVLFVAEKRAAIDAVLDRLNRTGLADLVLDLHDGAGSKRKLAADLARTLAVDRQHPQARLIAAQETLVRNRRALVDRAAPCTRPVNRGACSVYEPFRSAAPASRRRPHPRSG